jgi:hypothetical protein
VSNFLIIFLTCFACSGQALTIGVVGGVRATDDVNTSVAMPESRRYVVGPSVELRLPRNFSIEVDALYHRQGYRYVAPPIIGLSGIYDESERANSWEFPILLKYKLPVPTVKAFVEAGLSPRTISGKAADVNVVFNCCAYSPPTYTTTKVDSSGLGIVAGGGVQFLIGRLRVSPEARYTYWTSAPSLGPVQPGSQSQADILVGIGWKFR